MRLKENRDNWHARAIIKRDFKHDHSDPDVAYPSSKKTAQWCRGKVGVNHTMQWHKEVWLFGLAMNVGKCSTCGKHMYKDYPADR